MRKYKLLEVRPSNYVDELYELKLQNNFTKEIQYRDLILSIDKDVPTFCRKYLIDDKDYNINIME